MFRGKNYKKCHGSINRERVNEMTKITRDLPIYVLSASLIFLGITVSGNQASAAYDPNAAKIVALQNQLNNLQSQFSRFKNCANSNFNTISFYDASRDSRMVFVNTCY
jgi:hypothetical protein